MLCIEVWCEDSTEHIHVSSQCDEPIQISCEVDELVRIWSDLCEQIQISSEDDSDHIEIYSNWYPNIEVWSSFVCHIGDWKPYMAIMPNMVRFPCTGDIIRITQIFSNINWYINETNK